MSGVRRFLAGLIIVAISATAVSAEMPKALKGTWIIDAQATEKHTKAQPAWAAENAGILKAELHEMRKMICEFTDDAIIMSFPGLAYPLRYSVTLKESNSKKFVFDAKMPGKADTLTVTFVTATVITVERSGDDSLSHFRWKPWSLAISATAASAKMPKALKGTWIIDAQATEKYIKAQPEWDAENAGQLEEQLYEMRAMMFEFTDDAVVGSRPALKQHERIPVTLKESNPKKFIFEAKRKDQTVALTVTFVTDTAIAVEQSDDDSMRYYLWKRGSLPEKKAPSVKAPPQK